MCNYVNIDMIISEIMIDKVYTVSTLLPIPEDQHSYSLALALQVTV